MTCAAHGALHIEYCHAMTMRGHGVIWCNTKLFLRARFTLFIPPLRSSAARIQLGEKGSKVWTGPNREPESEFKVLQCLQQVLKLKECGTLLRFSSEMLWRAHSSPRMEAAADLQNHPWYPEYLEAIPSQYSSLADAMIPHRQSEAHTAIKLIEQRQCEARTTFQAQEPAVYHNEVYPRVFGYAHLHNDFPKGGDVRIPHEYEPLMTAVVVICRVQQQELRSQKQERRQGLQEAGKTCRKKHVATREGQYAHLLVSPRFLYTTAAAIWRSAEKSDPEVQG
ncbi:hypothetical protein IEO21_08669 [Rhodonia placenta]|uniref:Uncharacterized protein n=1 Tax=Rhodonia placenta TaxID=104341 RepID=A0A8H7NW19_9APHY|nr:hypothetical protein IEO21_08669 [Postia placenta]